MFSLFLWGVMQVLVLRSMYLEALVLRVSIDNIVEYIMFADSCSEPRLLEACKDHAACHRYEEI